jgi:cobalt-zinc-cadmium efflux system membrane fusion protein
MYLKNIRFAVLCYAIKIVLVIMLYNVSSLTLASGDHDNNLYGGNSDEQQEHTDSTVISNKQIALSNIKTEKASLQSLNITKTLFGVVSTPQDKIFRVFSTYQSLVKKVHVFEGQKVVEGQLLLTLFNKQNLQTYTISSPSKGEITRRLVNIGDHADENILLEIMDLSQVWIELSAFPKDIELLSKAQTVWVYDLHQHKKTQGEIIYVAPIMTNGHIARARALLQNRTDHWRPGMHIKANVVINKSTKSLVVKTSALQILDSNTVVFTKHGNTFKSTKVKTGISDDTYTQIINGLHIGDEYVSINSFIIKADIKKDGASHSH